VTKPTGKYWNLRELEKQVIEVFTEYGGWWRLDSMAEWCGTSVDHLRLVWSKLDRRGLLERKGK